MSSAWVLPHAKSGHSRVQNARVRERLGQFCPPRDARSEIAALAERHDGRISPLPGGGGARIPQVLQHEQPVRIQREFQPLVGGNVVVDRIQRPLPSE